MYALRTQYVLVREEDIRLNIVHNCSSMLNNEGITVETFETTNLIMHPIPCMQLRVITMTGLSLCTVLFIKELKADLTEVAMISTTHPSRCSLSEVFSFRILLPVV